MSHEKKRHLALIDDDDLIRQTWAMVAESCGHELHVFEDHFTFLEANLPKDIPIFVDLFLSDQVSGFEVIEGLLDKGYSSVYLTTGHPDPESIQSLPKGTSGVVGKNYPNL